MKHRTSTIDDLRVGGCFYFGNDSVTEYKLLTKVEGGGGYVVTCKRSDNEGDVERGHWPYGKKVYVL